MTATPASSGAGTEKLVALVTNGSQFAGPAALLGLSHLNCQVYGLNHPGESGDSVW